MPVDSATQKAEETPKISRDRLNPAFDGYTLTGDANIIHARATVVYTVSDPVQYLFTFTNAAQFVTNALNNALAYASARYTVDDVLTTKPGAFRECVERRVRLLVDQQRLGIEVGSVVTFPYAPAYLKATFEGVTTAYAEASQTTSLTTVATGQTQGSNVAVGASLALTTAVDTVSATLAQNLTAGGAVTLTLPAVASSAGLWCIFHNAVDQSCAVSAPATTMVRSMAYSRTGTTRVRTRTT